MATPLTGLGGGDLDEPLAVFGEEDGGNDDMVDPVCVGFGSVATANTRLVGLRTGILFGKLWWRRLGWIPP